MFKFLSFVVTVVFTVSSFLYGSIFGTSTPPPTQSESAAVVASLPSSPQPVAVPAVLGDSIVASSSSTQQSAPPSQPRVVTQIIHDGTPPQSVMEQSNTPSTSPQPVTVDAVTQSQLTEQLQNLQNSINTRFQSLSYGGGGSITNVYQQIADSQKIDQLQNTKITDPTITGGTIDTTALTVNGTPVVGGIQSQWTTNGNNIYYNSGNVGIGTTSPAAKLDVTFTNATSNVPDFTAMSANPTISGNLANGLPRTWYGIQSTPTITSSINGGGNGETLSLDGINSSPAINPTMHDGEDDLEVSGFNSSPTWNGSGIGPTDMVDVYGYMSLLNVNLGTTGFTGTFGVSLSNNSTADNNYGLAIGGVSNATNNYGIYVTGVDAAATNYALYSSAAAQSYFAGNVGIGSTTPTATLSVNGSVALSALPGGAGTAYICTTLANGLLSTSTTACNPSSIRFKDNVQNLSESEGLSAVMAMRPVTYTYKPSMLIPGQQIGFIAEEMASTVPEVVGYDSTNRPSNIDYAKLAPVFAKAIQEQQAEIEQLQSASSTQVFHDTSSLVAELSALSDTVIGGIVHFTEIVTEKITATLGVFQNVQVAHTIQINDEDTGAPYCVKIKSGQLVTIPGLCNQISSPSMATTTSDDTITSTTTDPVSTSTDVVIIESTQDASSTPTE